jgi:hypothetical protein
MERTCIKCGNEYFALDLCKSCYGKLQYQKAKERNAPWTNKKEYLKKYYQEHKEEMCLQSRQNYKKRGKDINRLQHQKYNEKCKELCCLCHNNDSGILCKYHMDKRYRENNKNILKIKKKEYEDNHRKEIQQYKKNRYDNDMQIKMAHLISTRIRLAIKEKNAYKKEKTRELIGCSISFLMKYIETRFDDEMSWNNHNYYGWHIDHIKPCNGFDLTKEEEQKKCFHYTNLQPLWGKDNISKGAR